MRRVFFFGLLVCFSISSNAQIVARLFYNKKWQLTKRDCVVYFRVSIFDTTNRVFVGEVKDFTKNGKLLMKGSYLRGKRNGGFTFYYENGQTKSSGEYVFGERSGSFKYFYPNGSPRAEIIFDPDDHSPQVLSFRDSTGTLLLNDGTGLWEEEYDDPGYSIPVVNSGYFKNHVKNGEWTCKLRDGTLVYVEKYERGKFVRGRVTMLTGREGPTRAPIQNHLLEAYRFQPIEQFEFAPGVSPEEYPFLKPRSSLEMMALRYDSTTAEVFTDVEEPAYPEGGMSRFYRTVADIMKFPADARRLGIDGKVFVEFVVNLDGSLSDVKVVKGIGGGCDEEAMRTVIESQKKCQWIPARQKGKPVRQRHTLPIIFQLR